MSNESKTNSPLSLKEIQELIKFVSKSGVEEVRFEQQDFKLVIKASSSAASAPAAHQQPVYHMPQQVAAAPQPQAPAATPQPAASKPAEAAAPAADESKYETVRSPMIGTFYRKPSPDKEPFAKPGDTVEKGQTVCIIEAMKLFNEIESDYSGKIVKVLVDDMTPVEYDQPLFLIEPM